MQAPIYVDVVKDDRGLFGTAWGHADGHMSDWRGPNYRRLNLPGWPRGKRLVDTAENRAVLQALCSAVSEKALLTKLRGRKGTSFNDKLVGFPG